MANTFDTLQQLTQQALDIGEQLERGQAETPLTDTLHQLQQQSAGQGLNVILLGLNEGSVERVLSWLCGDVFNGIQVTNTQKSGYLEVTLGATEYSLGLLGGQKKRFQEEQDFLQAMQIELGDVRSSVAKPISITLKEHNGSNQHSSALLTLLIPDSADALLDSPSLCNALTSQANVAFIASPLSYTLSREEHEAVEIIASNMKGLWPLLLVGDLNDDTALPEIGWWEQHTTAQQLIAPKLIVAGASASLPEFLTHVQNDQRQAYQHSFYSQKLQGAIAAVQDRFIQDSGILQNRQTKLRADIKQLNQADGSQLRELSSQLRRTIDEDLYKLKKKAEDQIQKISLQQSSLSLAVQAEINQLQFSDINTEQSHSVIKLTLQQSTVERIHNIALKEAYSAITAAVQNAHNDIKQLIAHINQQQDANGIPHILFELNDDELALRDKLTQRLELSINYRGEMPKRTTVTRLGESRKLFMSIGMMGMILGGSLSGMGVDIKKTISILAPLLLIGGFIYTYIQWPKEDAEKLEKELDRIRDSLASEVKRMASDIQRFIQQQINDLLERYKKAINDMLEGHLNQQRESQKAHAQQAQQKIEHKLQDVDASLKQWQSVERRIERLRQDVQALNRELS